METRDESRLCLPYGQQAQWHLICGCHQRFGGKAYQHRNGLIDGFTKDHGCNLLVWFDAYDDLQEARHRELQMKKWKRAWKIELIERDNPHWRDLFETLF